MGVGSILRSMRMLVQIASTVLKSPHHRPEYQTSSNATNAAEANKRRTTESTFPLSTDVVCLVSHRSRNIRVCSSSGKENTKVAHGRAFVEPHDRETNEAQ